MSQPSSPVSFTPKQKDKETIRQLRQENERLKQDIKSEKEKYDKSKLKVLETQNSNLRHDIDIKNAEIRKLTSTVQELHRECKINRDKLEATKSELELATSQLKSMQSQIAEFRKLGEEIE
ncbi:UNVERIFIED_CONTAM: hypothetical protein BEN50_13870 [Euhalothece sp. KZN 001]